MQTLMLLAMMLAGASSPAQPVSAPDTGNLATQEAALQSAPLSLPYQLVDGVDVPSKPQAKPKVRGVPAPQQSAAQSEQPIIVNVYIQNPAGSPAPSASDSINPEDAYYNPVMPMNYAAPSGYAQGGGIYPASAYNYYPDFPFEYGRRYKVGWRSKIPYYGGLRILDGYRGGGRWWGWPGGCWNSWNDCWGGGWNDWNCGWNGDWNNWNGGWNIWNGGSGHGDSGWDSGRGGHGDSSWKRGSFGGSRGFDGGRSGSLGRSPGISNRSSLGGGRPSAVSSGPAVMRGRPSYSAARPAISGRPSYTAGRPAISRQSYSASRPSMGGRPSSMGSRPSMGGSSRGGGSVRGGGGHR